jgi:hypothetical protein
MAREERQMSNHESPQSFLRRAGNGGDCFLRGEQGRERALLNLV